MQKSAIHLLLQKVAQGDVAAKGKIVPKLAERLVIVPTLASKNQGRETKVSIVTIREGERSLIPVFTTMSVLKAWLTKNEIQGEGTSINCADICLALGGNRWLMVDPGTDYWCELEPAIVSQIANFEFVDDDFDDEPIPIPVKPAAPSVQRSTMEVPVVPKELLKTAALNPSSDVQSFPRLRQKTDDDDIRATMDLTNFKKKFSS